MTAARILAADRIEEAMDEWFEKLEWNLSLRTQVEGA